MCAISTATTKNTSVDDTQTETRRTTVCGHRTPLTTEEAGSGGVRDRRLGDAQQRHSGDGQVLSWLSRL